MLLERLVMMTGEVLRQLFSFPDPPISLADGDWHMDEGFSDTCLIGLCVGTKSSIIQRWFSLRKLD